MAHDSTVFKNASWGRTRQPKNIAGPHGTEVAIIAHGGAPNDALTDATASENGYLTQNQRFLLVTCMAAGDVPGQNLEVYAYSYSSGKWALLSTLTTNNIAASTAKTFKVDVLGIDRVSFKRKTGAWTAEPDIYAACSTF